MSDEEEKPTPVRRVAVKRRLGDAQMMAGGSGVFLGDMVRVSGVEVVETDARDRTDTFEG